MADETDAVIAQSVTQAEELLNRLNLTPTERQWAKEQAQTAFKNASDTLFHADGALTEIRAIAVPAALAYALSIANDWAMKADEARTKQRG